MTISGLHSASAIETEMRDRFMKTSSKNKQNQTASIGETWEENWTEADDDAFLRLFHWAKEASQGKRNIPSVQSNSSGTSHMNVGENTNDGLLSETDLRQFFNLPASPNIID